MIKRDTPESIKLDSMGLEEDFLLTHGFKDVMLELSEASGWGSLASKTQRLVVSQEVRIICP
jgi:hypothetical protein